MVSGEGGCVFLCLTHMCCARTRSPALCRACVLTCGWVCGSQLSKANPAHDGFLQDVATVLLHALVRDRDTAMSWLSSPLRQWMLWSVRV